ncbi:hypothetical protein MMC30_000969 [Trapelia coarctata]|nr:hypothetical protein [Trapelia coarctata]
MEEKKKTMDSKKTFFNDLYAQDDVETTDESENEIALALRTSKKRAVTAITPEQKASVEARVPTATGRTMSSPIPLVRTSRPRTDDAIDRVKETPIAPAPTRPQISKQTTAPAKLSRGQTAKQTLPASKAGKKRKRGQSFELLPESQQIFRGKMFFFIPPNDIPLGRRLRIQRARERGAVWVKEWSHGIGITHVMVDRYLTYRDVIKYLKVTALPVDIILVNETYQSDCIGYKYLLNPHQAQYQLDGQAVATKVPQTPNSTNSSLVSLPLKPDKLKEPPQTPSRAEGSDQSSVNRELELLAKQYADKRAGEASRAAKRVAPKDALDDAIREAKEVAGLPLDFDEGDSPRATADEGNESDEEILKKASKSSRSAKGPNTEGWQQNFSCMQKHDGQDEGSNPNARTIEVLQKMVDYYNRTRDTWRVLAYRKAIGSLRKQTKKITTKAEALALPFVGTRLADKIEEIVLTNRLRRLDNATVDDPADQILQLFLGIYGVGIAQAQMWISLGYRTLEALTTSVALTPNQRIGIENYEDFQTRIPRSEVEAHAKFLRGHLAAVSPALELTVGGSYRRGAPDCGDIDFLITSPTLPLTALRTLLLESLVPRLFVLRYLRVALATCDPVTGTKWHGAACLPSAKIQTWRRVDFLLVPWEQMGAALIYWTGNDIFNRSMRLLASKKGMRLNQRGLFKDVMRGPGRFKITDGELVEGKSEKRIFEHLGVPWRPPEHRIC